MQTDRFVDEVPSVPCPTIGLAHRFVDDVCVFCGATEDEATEGLS